MHYWLLKTEPETFGIQHLEKAPQQTTAWEGVRNYQARNYMRVMKQGDLAFFYHSSCDTPGIVAIVKIVKEAHDDLSALDQTSPYFDAKSSTSNIRWTMVDVKLVKKFPHIITLSQLRQCEALSQMQLLRKGNRLSILPVTEHEWHTIESLAK